MLVDVVYTYVDGSDPAWRAGYADVTGTTPRSDIRFGDHGELALSIRLLLRHCGWVRRVYVVCGDSGIAQETLGKIEPFVAADRLWVVPQSDLLARPTWSSCVVEAVLHRLPGITPVFLYMNDDMGFGRRIPPELYFGPDGRPWADASRFAGKVRNLAQQHSEASYRLFMDRFPASPVPRVHAPHFPSMMTVRGGEQMWAWFGRELSGLEPVRTIRTLNTQLLNILVSVHLGLAVLRVGAHTQGVSRVLAEADPSRIVELRPHVYCVNGIQDKETFRKFAHQMLYPSRPPPKITVWSWAPPHVPAGDDRKTGVAECRANPAWAA